MRSDLHPLVTARRAALLLAATLLALSTANPVGAEPLPAAEVPTTAVPVPSAPEGTPLGAPQSAAAPRPAGRALVGTFVLTAGTCSESVKGSYFRMVQPGGTGSGPFVSNGDSPCADDTYTPMSPGTDRGLVTGSYQPEPSPAFDGSGNGLAARITKPQKFFGASFASATNPTDPQTGVKVAAPTISVDGSGRLIGDLRAFAATWNGQHFNQGSPKPDGSTPGATTVVSGTFDEKTKAFVLDWTSQIVGGPFNNFTGKWHLEGTFEGSATTPAASPSSTPTQSGGAPSGGTEVLSSGAVAPGSAGVGSGRLANTGPTVATGRGLWLLAAALGVLGVRNHLRRGAVPASGRDRG